MSGQAAVEERACIHANSGSRNQVHFFNYTKPQALQARSHACTIRSFWSRLFEYGTDFCCAVLLSRFFIPGGLYPAGVGFFLASISRGHRFQWYESLLILAGVGLGTYSVKGLAAACGISGCLFCLWSIAGCVNHFKKNSPALLFILACWAAIRFGLVAAFNPGWNTWIWTGSEFLGTAVLGFVFQKGIGFLENPLQKDSGQAILALALLTVLALGGTRGLVVYSINLTEIGSLLLLLIASYLGGGGAGAAMGIVIALILGVTAGNLFTLVATYGISGFLGGLFKNWGKWGTILGTGLGLGIIALQLHLDPAVMNQLLPWGIAMASFLVIPKSSLSQVSSYFPNENKAEEPESQRQIKEVIYGRLNDLAEIFAQIARSFYEEQQAQAARHKMDLYSLLDEVCTKNCQHCNGYEGCWGENFYATYREIFDLIAYAELYGEVGAKHLKGRLAKSCFQQFKLLASINQLFERCQAEYTWQRKLDESKVFVAEQLQGVSDIISNLAGEVTTDTSFKYEIEEKLRAGLNRVGMHIKELSVMTVRNQELEIRIRQHGCNQKRECVYLAGTMISRLLNQDYSVWEKNCQLENGDCSYCLVPTCSYQVRTTVCKLPKAGNESSGDTHTLQEMKDGHFLAILSDGMGQGNTAAAESNIAVSLLNKLLASGIDREFAVKLINSVLLLRSPHESFATVDLALIDLYTAQAEFIKIGAAATYVKRGKEVWSIKSTSLPAGILNDVDMERTIVQLQPGDMIIMATDGVVDSKAMVEGKEEWMVRALRQVEVVGPESLGEYLLSLAKINQDGIPQDDMTVIVLQVMEKGNINLV
ncbi:MAG TPA: stage II sporulation protein E [Bacillota bacterium]